jgi:GT2 family glycosyltransferase
VNERNELITHRDSLVTERNGLVTERDILTTERNNVINSRSWRITKPLRNIGAFIRRNKILYFFAKGIFSSKRKGIKKTTKKIANYKQKQVQNQSSLPVTNTFSSEAERVTHENNLFSSKIKFSIIVPLYDTHLPFLHQLIDSVRSQTYNNWELCLADGSPNNSEIEEICNKYIKNDSRIRYKHLETNLGISGNSNEAISMSTGDYIVLCDHDDILFSNALYENAMAIQETNADVLYSDEDFVDIKGTKHYYPFYKPDWSRDMLYSQMYICHLLVIRKEILDKTGWFNKEFDGSQDYDLMLRLSEHTELIYHIPKLLYSWRAVPTSTSINAASKTYAQDAGLNALNAHLLRKFNNMAHAYPTSELFVYEARFDTMQNKPLVSILIPMRDKAELTDQCIQSIINKSTYENFEIIIINNRSTEQNTFNWFDKIKKQESRISIIDADIEFNWSKINNIGIQHAKGIVYIFLNNDTIIITPDWIERLCENALRADIGAVGSLLLYEDGTIQHAGVVVGMNSWADHVFKGMLPANSRSPFVSPAISRNVLAVTGACMAVSRHTIEKIGTLNEDFIICGSDVEFCIRAYENGLSNLYNANVKLYHLESKSRDSFIPENDFEMSYKTYKTYRENIDPYFNPNLDINTAIPTVNTGENMNIQSFKNFLKRNETIYKLTKRMHTTIQNQIQKIEFSTDIPEVTPIGVRIDKILSDRKRLNLLIPSLDIKHVFGGISTALGFFQTLCDKTDTDIRIIITDAPFDKDNSILLNGYEMVNSNEDSSYPKQIIECYNRYGKTLPVGKNDIFVATAWWTAYNIYSIIHWQEKTFNVYNSLIYLIQDYEPGFYSWSSRYLMAESTYKNNISTIAVFNSRLLYDFFKIRGYLFKQEYYFDPVLNNSLREYLISEKIPMRKKQVIIYGRPSTPRNAFELIVASLKLWTAQQPNIQEWNILSVGETHPEIELSNGIIMKSIGKLSLEKYALLLKETYMGISLMVSPHPSYPPLEMSTFGVRTITNRYANKDLSNFNENVISLDNVSAENIAENLTQLADEYPNGSINITKSDYTEHPEDIFSDICENIIHLIL